MSVLADFFGVPLDVFNLATGPANRTASAVIAELERFLAERRRRTEPEGNETIAVLARSASRLSPPQGGQARVMQYVRRLEEVEQMENEAGA